MGTRALRKLREKEWEKQLAASQSEDQEESEEEEPVIILKPRNAFDMLNAAEDNVDEEEDEDNQEDAGKSETVPSQPSPQPASTPKSSKKKKKKPKKKQKGTSDTPQELESKEASEDEIDKALKELAVKQKQPLEDESQVQEDAWEQSATKLLAIESKNLDPVNEMRGLFGRIALEDDSQSRSQPTRRREQNLQGGVDLQTALSGRYNPASRGKELGSLAKRRNCFIQGKEEWPLASNGGLSMEALPVESFERRYVIRHNQLYRAAQMDFRYAVESMQAESMIAMLQKHPYHVASLLQVSEIAKHQGDNSLSGDLLERALFTIGRSVHSSFPAAMREGCARLDFNESPNRELYLTIWRYVRNLEQRGTWKTAFEWSKILLQLNTISDPYAVTLMIDQLALRGRQHQQFLDLTADTAYGPAWSHLPNICISKSLALLRAQKPKEARQQLALAMHRYPYILAALASAIEVTPIPKSIWGKTPSSDAEKLYSELYITRAKDLWNTPETIGLITEVANTSQYYKSFVDAQSSPAKLQISLEEARHVMALEIPALIALLPRQYTNMPTSSTDILPPPNSSATDLTRRAPTEGPGAANGGPGLIALSGDTVLRVLRNFFAPADATNAQDGAQGDSPAADLQALRQELGSEGANMSDDDIHQMLASQIAEVLDGEELQQAFTAGPMVGGWDYYDDAEADGRAEDEDSIPDLESIGDETQEQPPVRGPHAAMVEEDDSEDENSRSADRSAPQSGALLRHVDSDDEEPLATGPLLSNQRATATATTTAPVQPVPTPPITQPSNLSQATDEEIEDNPQRLQRWLIGVGLEEVKSDPNISTYVRRLKKLHRNQQTWVLNMLRQRGESDLVKRVEQAL